MASRIARSLGHKAPQAFPRLPINVGTDICSVQRIRKLLEGPLGHRFIGRTVSQDELLLAKPAVRQWLMDRMIRQGPAPATLLRWDLLVSQAAEFLAGRFAAKEAVIKAHPHLSLTMENVQILRQKQADVGGGQIVYSGAPIALIRAPVDPLGEPASGPVEAGAAARHGGISEREGEEYEDLVASVSISHDADMATAVCIGIDQTIPPPSAEEEVEEHGIVGVEDVDKADVMDSERTEAAPAPAAGTIAGTSEVQTGRMSLWEKFGRKETTTITTTSTTTSQKEGASAPGPALVDEAQQDLEFLVVHLLCDAIGHTERFVNQAISVSGKYEVKWSPERVQLQRRYNRLAQQFSYLSRKWEQRKQQRKSWSSTSTIWPPKEYHGYWTDCAFRIQREVKVLTAVCSKVKAMARGLPVSAKGEKKPTVPGDSLVALMLAIEPSVQFLRHIVYRFLKQHELGLKEEQDRDQDRDQAGSSQGGKVDASEE